MGEQSLERVQELNDRLDRELSSEALIRLLVDMTLDGLAVVRNGRIVYVSQMFSEVFGYRDDELLNQNIQVLVPQEHRDIHQEHMDIYFKRPRSLRMSFRRPVSGIKKDGTVFKLEVGLSPLGITSEGARDILVAIRVPEDAALYHAETGTGA